MLLSLWATLTDFTFKVGLLPRGRIGKHVGEHDPSAFRVDVIIPLVTSITRGRNPTLLYYHILQCVKFPLNFTLVYRVALLLILCRPIFVHVAFS